MPEVPQPSQPACPQSVSRESTQPRKSTSWNGDKPRGIDKDLLKLIEPLVREQGWRYEHGHHGKKNRLWHPDGKTFQVIPHTGEDSYLAIHRTRSQLRRKGAQL